MSNIDKRINFSNKIYPLFYGLSSDLIFFVAINTLFLTTVKGLTPSEINSTAMIGVFVSLFFYLQSYKIIKKIGNLNSIKLGTLLILISSILFTFSTKYIFFVLAEILYEVSFVFKSVDTVILNNNLMYQNREKEFVKIKSQATTIYSVATLIASLVAGFLFNLNPYIPMIICILICVSNYGLAHFIYEIKDNEEKKISNKKEKMNLKFGILVILIYGLLYGTVVVVQTNDKIYMQYKLQEFLNIDYVAIMISIALFLSRISRLLINIFFIKIYNKLEYKILYLINGTLIFSILLFVLGDILPYPLIGFIMMVIGFLLLLTLRDPIETILSNILLKNTKKDNKEQAMLYFQFCRRLIVFLISLLATLVLARYKLIYLYVIILIATILYLFGVTKLYKIIKE